MKEQPIRLQGIGWGPGIQAQNIKVGDRLMWNYGYVSEVVGIDPAGEKFLNFSLKDEAGKVWPRRMGKERLVAKMKDR